MAEDAGISFWVKRRSLHIPVCDVTHHFPSIALLAQLPVEDIATIGVPKSRAATIQNLARFALEGGLQQKIGASADAVVADLKTVVGIGEWTAQYIALRALRFPDAFPAGDLGLQKAAAGEDSATARLTERQLLACAAAWSPWRAYAALALWHSLR